MSHIQRLPWQPRRTAFVLALAAWTIGYAPTGHATQEVDRNVDSIKTVTPIKHVIIIVGENRSFDHLFATYVPANKHEKVHNLLSEGIVNADGTPGKNFSRAHQYKIVSAPNGGKFFISADLKDKMLYFFLPPPDVAGTPAVSALSFILSAPFFPPGDPGLPPQQLMIPTELVKRESVRRLDFAPASARVPVHANVS